MSTCTNCSQPFHIRDEDKKFYDLIKVPEPTHCPTCRRQRRLAVRNERFLYKRKCDLCGDETIATFPQESEYKVFCNSCWRSDAWSGLDYGQDFDFNRPFFEQFSELEKKVPHFATFNDVNSEDCKFTNYGLQNKSCYLALCVFSENIYFSHGIVFSKSCIDSTKINNCELCCECLDCLNCYQIAYSKDCENCNESMFLDNCTGCKNSFLCTGQRNKQYMVMNQQLTKEQYQEYISQIELSYDMVEACKKKLSELSLTSPKKYIHGVNHENCSGDYINNCKNCFESFDCANGLTDSAYCDFCGVDSHMLHDCSFTGGGTTQCYENVGTSSCNNVKFNYYSKPCSNSEYIQYSSGSNLFGCVGLDKKEYCILNKQYSPEEYFHLKSQIIEHMKRTGEYGEFFPISISAYPYNETVAYEYYPMTKEQVEAKGWKWKDKEQKENQPATTVPPKLIQDVPREITSEILTCKKCCENYKVMTRELALRQQIGVPLNPYCPECRHADRFQQRNKQKLYNRQCNKCQTSIQTTYSPNQPEIVYCEKCYLETIY